MLEARKYISSQEIKKEVLETDDIDISEKEEVNFEIQNRIKKIKQEEEQEDNSYYNLDRKSEENVRNFIAVQNHQSNNEKLTCDILYNDEKKINTYCQSKINVDNGREYQTRKENSEVAGNSDEISRVPHHLRYLLTYKYRSKAIKEALANGILDEETVALQTKTKVKRSWSRRVRKKKTLAQKDDDTLFTMPPGIKKNVKCSRIYQTRKRNSELENNSDTISPGSSGPKNNIEKNQKYQTRKRNSELENNTDSISPSSSGPKNNNESSHKYQIKKQKSAVENDSNTKRPMQSGSRTVAQRSHEYRERKKLIQIANGTYDPIAISERSRKYRENRKKRGPGILEDLRKKPFPKSGAQRTQEYRARKKLLEMVNNLDTVHKLPCPLKTNVNCNREYQTRKKTLESENHTDTISTVPPESKNNFECNGENRATNKKLELKNDLNTKSTVPQTPPKTCVEHIQDYQNRDEKLELVNDLDTMSTVFSVSNTSTEQSQEYQDEQKNYETSHDHYDDIDSPLLSENEEISNDVDDDIIYIYSSSDTSDDSDEDNNQSF